MPYIIDMTNAAVLAKIINRNARHAEKFGTRKAYIASVFSELPAAYQAKGLDSFKSDLAELNRAGLVALCRGDLVKAMDGNLLRASEMTHLNATFHFIEIVG